MKSRMKLVTLSTVLGATLSVAPSYAAFTDTQATRSTTLSTWEKVTSTVKVTVSEWMSYWQDDTTTPPVAPATVVKQVTPAPKVAAESATARAVELQTQVAAPLDTQGTKAAPAAGAPGSKPVVATEASDAVKALQKQPVFATKAEGSSLRDVQKARDAVQAAQFLKVLKPGRAGTTKLAKSKVGVPVTNWAALKKMTAKRIPRLDIGTETLISREDFTMKDLHWGVQQASDFKRLPEAKALNPKEMKSLSALHVVRALGPRGLQAGFRTLGKAVTEEEIAKIKYTLNEVPQFKELPYKPLNEDQMKMLAALILFDKGSHCHMIMGLFHQLAQSDKVRTEATFHLGACAADLKMHQSAYDNLAKVIVTEDKEFAADALGILAKDLLVIYEKDFYTLVKGLKNPKSLIREKTSDDITYRMAKGAYRAGDFKTSALYAAQVSEGAAFYDDARFLIAMNNFALGDKPGALKKLQALWASLEQRNVGDSNLRALISVNLARMFFAQKKFDKALEQYMKVPKNHPLWVQALIEQGWTQLANEDYSGAIGNMYSLHSPYFKAVYQPESFVVRTIGYLNICQYGDAYKSLSWLEKDYRDWYGKTSNYLANNGQASSIYATVKNYIRGKSTDDVDGVPFQVWREMAHRKDFLNVQTALNDKQDEAKRYEGVNQKIKEEKASIRWHADQGKKRFDQWRAQIAKAKVDKSLAKNLPQMNASLKLEKDLTISYRYQLTILEQSRQGYLDFQNKSQSKLDSESAALGNKAGTILLTHAKNMQKEMSRVLDNNEFLRYEVFAGSGENIRYQVAGGKVDTNNRVPASIKPAKMMNWNFDGEFWEDEIGSYRSSLQNNCPVNQQARKAERVPAEQARHVDEDEN